MAAGDFTASYLSEVQLRQDNVFRNGRHKRELTYPQDAIRAFLERQDVAWDPILQGKQCVGMKADWLRDCQDASDTDGTDVACDITGTPIESKKNNYAPNFAEREVFAVADDECKDVYTAQQKIAHAMVTKKIKLIKKLVARYLAFFNANAQTSVFTGPGVTANGTTYEFGEASVNPEFFGRLHNIAVLNRFENFYAVMGNPFWEANWNANYNVRNDNQRDQAPKLGSLMPVWDPVNFLDLQMLNKLFVVESGAFGAFFQNDFESLAPTELKSDMFTWQEPLLDLMYNDGGVMKPVMVDVRMTRDCVIMEKTHRNVPRVGMNFEIILAGGLYLGPEDCGTGTGILEFEMIPASSGGGE